jgi:hypothetical protein
MHRSDDSSPMKHSVAASALAVVLAAGTSACASSPTAVPAAPPPPAFDTIDLDVSGGANPAVITYDTDHGSDPQSRTWQVVQTTPFHLELAKPHGAHDLKMTAMTMAFQGAPAFNCSVRINGQVVAAGEETEPGGGTTCVYNGTPS